MVSGPEREQFLDPYIRQLGLNWRVTAGVDPSVDRPSIVSTRQTQEHRIAFPPGHIEKYRADVVHELVHAKFAESLDPIFSAVLFHPSYDLTDPIVREQAQMVYLAQMPVEVWVSDRMHRVDKKLAQEDVSTWLRSMRVLPGEELPRIATETVVMYAVNEAQLKRQRVRGFDSDQRRTLQKIQQFLGRDASNTAQRLGRFFEGLPQLSRSRDEALAQFENATQRTSQMLEFPLQPVIVQHEGNAVWTIEQRSGQ